MTERNQEARILIIGSLNVDFILTVPQHPAGQDHVLAISDDTEPGGHGANQAVACAKLSKTTSGLREKPLEIHVALIGAVGHLMSTGSSGPGNEPSEHGEFILNKLKENHVDISGIEVIPTEKTGFAHITVAKNDPNNPKVAVIGHANSHLKPEKFPEFPTPRPDILLLQLEIPSETVHHLIRLAKKNEVPVILNAAPRQPLPGSIISLVDHLILNEIEADELTGGSSRIPHRQETLHEIQQHYISACEHFQDLGARNVVITLNDLGAVGSSMEDSGRRKRYAFDAAVGPEGVKDSTGASDTFVGAYAVEVIRQAKLEGTFDMGTIIDFAIQAAGITIGKIGSMNSIPFRAAVFGTKFSKAEIF